VDAISQCTTCAGLGAAMTEKLLEPARRDQLHKIELRVVTNNTTTIHLCEKFNFEIEGITKASFFGPDGEYHDLVHMGIVLT
jgi:RimJ/RimL family protein N-acetyltransferase